MSRLFLLPLLLAVGAEPARAQCDIAITGAFASDASRRRPPRVGEPYQLVVQFNVEGQPAQPYRIRFQLANYAYSLYDIRAANGLGFLYYYEIAIPLDGEIPWRIEIDPANVSGDVNRANNTAEGTFEPRYPREAIATYDTRVLEATQSGTIRFRPNGGTVERLFACFGVPTPSAYQRILADTPPAGAETVVTAPHGRPVYQWRSTGLTEPEVTVERRFTVEVSSVRSNPKLLREVRWRDYADLPPEIAAWQQPERWAPSDAPEVLEFVHGALPADYRETLTPYDTARLLHQAVMSYMDYQSAETPVWDALQSLEAKRGNCGNTATLLATLVRAVGIPSRVISGWGEETTSAGHSWVEIYFPERGWMPADPTWARGDDPDGKYAYYFGQMPHLNQFCAVTTGIEHQTEEWSIDGLISPFVWTGTAEEETVVMRTRLAPPRRAGRDEPPPA